MFDFRLSFVILSRRAWGIGGKIPHTNSSLVKMHGSFIGNFNRGCDPVCFMFLHNESNSLCGIQKVPCNELFTIETHSLDLEFRNMPWDDCHLSNKQKRVKVSSEKVKI